MCTQAQVGNRHSHTKFCLHGKILVLLLHVTKNMSTLFCTQIFYFRIPFSSTSYHLQDIQGQVTDLFKGVYFKSFKLKNVYKLFFKRITIKMFFLNRHWHNLLFLYIDKTILRFQVVKNMYNFFAWMYSDIFQGLKTLWLISFIDYSSW